MAVLQSGVDLGGQQGGGRIPGQGLFGADAGQGQHPALFSLGQCPQGVHPGPGPDAIGAAGLGIGAGAGSPSRLIAAGGVVDVVAGLRLLGGPVGAARRVVDLAVAVRIRAALVAGNFPYGFPVAAGRVVNVVAGLCRGPLLVTAGGVVGRMMDA